MSQYISETVISYQKKISPKSNISSIIVGEIHTNKSVSTYKQLLSKYSFDFFLSEFAYEDICMTREELKNRLDNASNGTYTSQCDKQDNYAIYKLAYDYNIPLIGCDLLTNGRKFKDTNDKFKARESRMLQVINKYISKGKCLVQLGDTHLRSIPYDKEYLDYIGDNTQEYLENMSPIYKKYENSNNVLIARVEKYYRLEQEFKNK